VLFPLQIDMTHWYSRDIFFVHHLPPIRAIYATCQVYCRYHKTSQWLHLSSTTI